MRTVAVMQPYFIPYAGYFRLFAASDIFVILDCVQFPRRGWVHRNRLPDRTEKLHWLTLPLEKGPQQTTLIRDLRFRPDANTEMLELSRRFPLFESPSPTILEMAQNILLPAGMVVEYVIEIFKGACSVLNLPFNVIRSSELDVDPSLHGWKRIASIARQLEAEKYLNSPGGVGLYNQSDFYHYGIKLQFLPPYEGATGSILQRLHTDGANVVRNEILRNTKLLPA